ncbi:MAG: UvrD-helicase domain-containing protein [Clostridia bacterium]|nr:UvrD-helicase domain-containing protein [Clostridia bacterium]
MSRNWTTEQLSAIETREKTLLVSAAAGSGKTTVLTERIIRLLTDPQTPASIDRMLIVTFTRAAAAELRLRLSAALGEALARDPGNRHLHRQLLALSSAKISTIHAYCLDLIRANFQRLGLPAQFRVADEAESGVLSRTVMDELIGRRYAEDPAFGALADHFTGARSDKALADIFLSLYGQLSAYPDGIAFLRQSADSLRQNGLSMQTGWGSVIAARTRRFYAEADAALSAACADMADDDAMSRAYLPAFSADLDHIRDVLAALDSADYTLLRGAVRAYQPERLGSLRGVSKSEESVRFKLTRDAFKDNRAKLEKEFFSPDSDTLRAAITDTADALDQLHALFADFDRRLSAEKKRRGICDFSDIERYTLALLVTPEGEDSDIARGIAEGLDVICIDEYQDVNAVQDRIFRAIARPHTRFMVGDIKQSIYRFRGAEPSIFADYRRVFPALGQADGADAASIFMSSNFRCDAPIIHCANRIFAFLFGHCGESIGYLPEDDLVCGKPETGTPAPVTLALCAAPADEEFPEDEDEVSPEYRYIAAEIVHLLREGRLDDGSPIRPADIAILMRSKTDIDALSAELALAGIPCAAGAASDFFANPEVLMMLCLLNTIDNPNRDAYFAGTLRSPLFGFTMDELIAVRQADALPDEPLYAAFVRYTEANAWEKGQRFLARLADYRAMAEGTPVDRLLNQLYRDTAVLAFSGASDDEDGRPRSPEQKRANLQLLYDYARRFEAGSYKGLYNFIRYLDDIIAEGTKIDAPGPLSDDAVQLLTIHQSKGLEFPVCFVCGLGRRFNLRDASENLLFDHSIGIALRLRDETGFARRTTPIRDAIAARITDNQLEEEMRILYVALTRARERLYLTARTDKPEEICQRAELRRSTAGPDALMRCGCYLDWILTALSGTPEDCWRLVLPEYSVLSPLALAVPQAPAIADDAQITEIAETLSARFAFVYPDAHLTELPAKLAVSRLSPTLLDEAALPDRVEKAIVLPELRQRPAFLDGFAQSSAEAAAERGTATHVFLQFCDFARCAADPSPQGIAAEAERLVQARFITPRMAELLRTDELSAFFRSPFYAELADAEWVLRERRFHLFLPAAAFTTDPDYAAELGEEKILVQGVIDLCFTDRAGRLILCDYKTDRLPRDPAAARALLRERHGGQLGYYAEACRALFGRVPDRICLWSLALGEPVDL